MVRRLICLPCLALSAWTLTLGWLIVDDRYTHFLAPKFQLLVYTGALLSLLFTLGAALQPQESTRNQLVRGLILILPILFILSAGDATLGNFAMSKRGISSGRNVPSAPKSETPQTPDPAAPQTPLAASLPGPPEPQAQAGRAMAISISQLIKNWDDYDGKNISVEGIFSQSVVGHDELSAVFRYLITCCVADALPVGIFLERAAVEGLDGDDWVRASGRVSKVQLDGYWIIFMAPASVEKQKKPSKNAAYFFK